MGPGLALCQVFLLQAVAFGQQGRVLGRQVGHEGIEALPEGGRLDAGARQHLLVDEGVQFVGHLQAVDVGTCGHEKPPSGN